MYICRKQFLNVYVLISFTVYNSLHDYYFETIQIASLRKKNIVTNLYLILSTLEFYLVILFSERACKKVRHYLALKEAFKSFGKYSEKIFLYTKDVYIHAT